MQVCRWKFLVKACHYLTGQFSPVVSCYRASPKCNTHAAAWACIEILRQHSRTRQGVKSCLLPLEFLHSCTCMDHVSALIISSLLGELSRKPNLFREWSATPTGIKGIKNQPSKCSASVNQQSSATCWTAALYYSITPQYIQGGSLGICSVHLPDCLRFFVAAASDGLCPGCLPALLWLFVTPITHPTHFQLNCF